VTQRIPKLFFYLGIIALLCACSGAQGSLIFLYDFPGSPAGSGLAVDQTNAQPAQATFSDFTRQGGLTADPTAAQFRSNNWNVGPTIDSNVYVGFTITAQAGYVLNLTDVTFDAIRKSTGPTGGEVDLYLNGSASAYASMTYTPTGALASYTLDFTDLTTADNVTSATFKFFGSGGTGGVNCILGFDNVATNGTIVVVPEIPVGWPAFFLIVTATIWENRRRSRRPADRIGKGEK
jgi:hypothetical protein